jgi:outer membrane receptor protein involved in Fe transport
LLGTQAGTITNVDGEFVLESSNIPEGEYDIEIKYLGYKTEVRRRMRIDSKASLTLNLTLETEEQMLADVVVTARKNYENERQLLLERQKSIVAVQSVGAKELSRKGISDAKGAVTKVAGVSKQEGVKNVFVRGLGDRYNSTSLNGFSLPSEDPEYKNISLDFFGTDIIQSVGVNKAFSADGNSDVGGATINIVSKEQQEDGSFLASLTGGLNTQTLSAKFFRPNGVNILGMARRTEPANEQTWGFANRLDPTKDGTQVNRSINLAGGKRFYLGSRRNPLAFFLTAGHSADYQYTDEQVRNTTTDGTIYKDMAGQKSEEDISQLALANVNLHWNEHHRLSYNFLLVHATTTSVGNYTGRDDIFSDDYNNQGFTRRQQANDNLLMTHQLLTRWSLANVWILDAGAAYNTVNGHEPDRRINNLTRSEGGYSLLRGNNQQRYFSNLNEKDADVKASLTYRLKDRVGGELSNLRVGYTGRFVDDDFRATEYNLTVGHSATVPSLDDFSLDDYYNADNLAAGWFEMQKNVDTYSVNKRIHSAYAEATYQFSRRLTANLGLKYDQVNINVDYNVNRGGSQGSDAISKSFFLPSLNLRYNFDERHALRLGASKTYTLPQAKEISPYRYVGVNFSSQGNPHLQPSESYNIDLKWDFNPTPAELVSATVFYKRVKNPIARIEVASAGGYLSYENIARHATVAGVELELRKHLFSRSSGSADAESMNQLTLGLNGSYIYTHAKMPLATNTSGSQLEGAAPWIVNADLSYVFSQGRRSFTQTLVAGYMSEKVYTIGTQGFGDILERGVPTLDFVSQAQLNRRLSLHLKALNLLNPSNRLSRKAGKDGTKTVLGNYKKGIHVSLGVTCKF